MGGRAYTTKRTMGQGCEHPEGAPVGIGTGPKAEAEGPYGLAGPAIAATSLSACPNIGLCEAPVWASPSGSLNPCPPPFSIARKGHSDGRGGRYIADYFKKKQEHVASKARGATCSAIRG